jgi:hypothetical protein
MSTAAAAGARLIGRDHELEQVVRFLQRDSSSTRP